MFLISKYFSNFLDLEHQVPTLLTLRQAKHECMLERIISTDVLLDVMKIKKMDINCLELNKSQLLRGFIKDIHCDPFGFLMLSQIQVRKIKNTT